MLHHKSLAELEQSLNHIIGAPKDLGRVELIVCRAVLAEGRLSPIEGLVGGDNWKRRGDSTRKWQS